MACCHGAYKPKKPGSYVAKGDTCPSPAFTARKSAAVSPTVVDMILIIQKDSVIAGTFTNQSFESIVFKGEIFMIVYLR